VRTMRSPLRQSADVMAVTFSGGSGVIVDVSHAVPAFAAPKTTISTMPMPHSCLTTPAASASPDDAVIGLATRLRSATRCRCCSPSGYITLDVKVSTNALRSMVSATAQRSSGLSKAAMAYLLVCPLRRIALRHTQFATCCTIRLRMFKIGALVRVSVRRIKIAMASGSLRNNCTLRILASCEVPELLISGAWRCHSSCMVQPGRRTVLRHSHRGDSDRFPRFRHCESA
jgi:hypothetical protein